MTEQKLRLRFGYKGPDGITHQDVVFGKRMKGADLFMMSEDDDFSQQTKRQLLMYAAAIIEFGTLRMPVPMTVLLSLNRADRFELARGYGRFLEESAEGRKIEDVLEAGRVSQTKIKLAFGIERAGVNYNVVEFGNLIDGYTELEADDYSGWRHDCFIMGKEIVGLSQCDGQATAPGPIPLEVFEAMDAADIFALQAKETAWLNSFRDSAEETEAPAENRVENS
ncbi:MAG TPA: hypothetical protein VF543_22385 [Pyrinomonadaceae bacterium]